LIKIDIGVDLYKRVPGLGIYLIIFIVLILCVPLMFHPAIERLIISVFSHIPRMSKFKDVFLKVFKAFQIYGGKLPILFAALLTGLALQANYIIHFYLIARSLEIDQTLAFFFVLIPIRAVVLMIPLFISGIGLREGFDKSVFAFVFVAPSVAVAFAELTFLVQIFFALIGGIIYVGRKRSPI
jgi:glycosyltransferase 2 family protein